MSRRLQITLSDELYDELTRCSAETGASIAELIRRAIAANRGDGEPSTRARLTQLRRSSGAWQQSSDAKRPTSGEAYVEQIRRSR